MQKVKMLKTAQGSPNGIEIMTYVEGKTYELPQALVDAFFDMGVAELEDAAPRKAPETAVKTKAPETKKAGKKK